MTFDEYTLATQRLIRLHEEMSTVIGDFPRKSEAMDYLRWAIINMTEKLWMKSKLDEA
jgi:hypothetical protein